MDNAEKLATLGTQDTRRRQKKKKKKKKKNQKTPQDNMCWTPLYANKHK
jgi:hypothetical protein